MAATLPRHQGTYARPKQTLPMSMPSKSSSTKYAKPTTRVASSPPELSDTSTIYSSRRSGGTLSDISDEYDSRYGDINVEDQLSARFEKLWDPTKMDRVIADQAKTSGGLNAKVRELDDVQARLARRLQKSRVNFDETMAEVSEARSDLKSSRRTLDAAKSRAMKMDPDAYEDARRARHSRR